MSYNNMSLFSLFFPVAPTLERRASVKLQFLNPKTIGRTHLTEDQPVARPLPTQDSTNRINADIHALSGFRTHDSSVQANEHSSCLRPRGHCDRRNSIWRDKKVPEGVNILNLLVVTCDLNLSIIKDNKNILHI
jgi:hypothetical protein